MKGPAGERRPGSAGRLGARLAELVRLGRPPEPATRALGRRGEHAAAKLLRREGYRILGRNIRVPMGEADLVCTAPDGRTLVIVEVKSRLDAGPNAPLPSANIDARKRAKLVSIAQHLARANDRADRPVRIDVVEAVFDHDRSAPKLRHLPGAVTPGR